MNYILLFIQLIVLFLTDVSGQITGPDRPTTGARLYLQESGSPNEFAIANFTVLNAAFFTDEQNSTLWCQSAINGNPIGDWYFPAGGQVSVNDADGPLHVLHLDGQIGLLRDQAVVGLEGLYNCVIPDENNITQTLWVGIYRNPIYNDANKNFIIDNPMEFSLVSSSSDTDPPVFTLSFNVTNVPPTTVQCYVENAIIEIQYVDRLVLMAEDPVRVLVTVTINSRQSGSYHCSVMADSPGGISTLTDSLDITAIPAIDVSIGGDHNGSVLIEGTYIELVCTASYKEQIIADNTVTFKWLRNGLTINNGSESNYYITETVISEKYTSSLYISELKKTSTTDVYTCYVTATSASLNISTSTGFDEVSFSVKAFQQSDISVAITFSCVPIVGDILNVTCSATVPERFIYSPSTFIISYDSGAQMVVAEDNPDATQSAISTDGNIFSRVVTVNPVKTSDARRYHCIVAFDMPSTVFSSNNVDIPLYILYNLSNIISTTTDYQSTSTATTTTTVSDSSTFIIRVLVILVVFLVLGIIIVMISFSIIVVVFYSRKNKSKNDINNGSVVKMSDVIQMAQSPAYGDSVPTRPSTNTSKDNIYDYVATDDYI